MISTVVIYLFIMSAALFLILCGVSIIIEVLNALADKFGFNFYIDDVGLLRIIILCGEASLYSGLLIILLKIIGE